MATTSPSNPIPAEIADLRRVLIEVEIQGYGWPLDEDGKPDQTRTMAMVSPAAGPDDLTLEVPVVELIESA